MTTPILSDEKHTHLAHIILDSLKAISQASLIGDHAQSLREIKRVLTEHMLAEEELAQQVRTRLKSYSRQIPEGSQEWDVLYQKTYEEALRKKNLK
ncbi:MAG: DUF507 family protein [Nitrospirales bacterium]